MGDDLSDLVEVMEPLVYGVLKKLGVGTHFMDYDDCLQVGRIKLLESYQKFPQKILSEEEVDAFAGFAYTRVRWAVVDVLRKSARQQTLNLEDDYEGSMDDSDLGLVVEKDFLDQLSDREKAFVDLRMHSTLSMEQIGENLGVSRKTLYAWRKVIGEKYKRFEEEK